VDSARFEHLVAEAVNSLPEEISERMENVDVVVADRPTREQLRVLKGRKGDTLFGLYEGVPLTSRSHGYGLVMPDKITIFQEPIESRCRNDAQIVKEVRRVVLHEIAHHFGISDRRLWDMGRY
jgi:predicted Zn-dependent protease with MMP-like domain